MTRINYDQVAGLADAMPTDNYEIIFGTIPGGGDSRELTLRAQQVVIPGMSNEVLAVTLHSFDFVFSGKNTFPKTLTIGFVEGSKNMPVMKAIERWQQMVRGTKSGTSAGYSREYTVDAELNVYDSPGNLVKTCKLIRMMPQDRPDIQLDSTSTQAMLQTITFGYWKSISSDVAER